MEQPLGNADDESKLMEYLTAFGGMTKELPAKVAKWLDVEVEKS